MKQIKQVKSKSQVLIALFLALFIGSGSMNAQSKRQNWLAGNSSYNSAGNFVTKGVANPLAEPPARYYAMSWVDSVGDFWTFGGQINVGGTAQYGNDLWKWNGVDWIWVSGESTADNAGVYGSQGVPSATTTPGARRHSVIWDDNQGNVYLFGGVGPGELHFNDLWKWDGSQWTWLSGSNTTNQTATYGTMGVANSSNVPGARYAAAAWTADNGDLFLFGGFGRTASGTGTLQDLWKWDGTNWTWVDGSDQHTQSGSYGTMGSGQTSNVPGARIRSAYWKDENGDFWLYGGQAYVGGTLILATDLWRWDGTNWIWEKGSSTASEAANHGTINVSHTGNTPGPRTSAMSWFNPENNKAYLLGGGDYNVHNNDIWEWDGTDWTWVYGTNLAAQASVFNTKGISSSTESIGGIREGNATIDGFGNVYIFGGRHENSGNRSNSLWRLEEGTFYDGSGWSNGEPLASSINAYFNVSVVNSDNLSCKNLYLSGGDYSVRGSITVSGSIIKNGGDMNGNGTLILNDQSAEAKAQIIGDTISFQGVVEIPSGASFRTNGKLTLYAASATRYGEMILDGTLEGDLTMELWLNLGDSANNGRYFYLGTPFSDVTVNDFNNGGHFEVNNADPGKTTVWKWSPTAAEWVNSLGTAAIGGQTPHAFYVGNNSYGNFLKSDSLAGKISITGTLNSNPSASHGFEYNNGQSSTVTFVGGSALAATEGWNMVANPYPSQYDNNENITDGSASPSIYVWDGQTFQTYNNGVGAARYVAPFQAFFMQRQTPTQQAFPSVRFVSEGRITNQSASLMKKSNVDNVNIAIHKGAKKLDEAWIGFRLDAEEGFDKYDAWELNGNENSPSLYSKMAQNACSINRLNSDSTEHEVPLHFGYKNQDGNTFTFAIDISDLHSYQSLWVKDLKTGRFLDLMENSEFDFVHDDSFYGPRFMLYFAKKEVGLDENIKNDFFVHSKSGAMEVVFGSEQENTKVFVYNSAGAVVAEKNANSKRIVFDGLGHGIYLLKIQTNNGPVFSEKVIVQ